MSNYLKALSDDIRPWLDKIDRVREVMGSDFGKLVKIPTIAVIGV
jgi:hypothetical protein